MLEIGIKAPDFSLLDQDGKLHNLKDYIGKKVILYFYPKDNTPGCSKQADGFNNLYDSYKKENAIIIGISKDSVASHKKFADKYSLKFPILSDEGLDVLQSYDVWKEKKNYGKTYMGIVRTTYVIDEKGYIVYASDKVKAASNPEQMLREISCSCEE